jgi:hypothetical protein
MRLRAFWPLAIVLAFTVEASASDVDWSEYVDNSPRPVASAPAKAKKTSVKRTARKAKASKAKAKAKARSKAKRRR